jgi:nucleotide-binding universal stress UspA family protein
MTITQERPQASASSSVPSSYTTLLVHAEPGFASSHRVQAAACLARDLGARLIGLGAAALDVFPGSEFGTGYAGEWLVLMQEQVNNDLQAAEQGFRRDAAGAELEWRSAQDLPNRAMAGAARAADLLIASPRGKTGAVRAVDPAELVMTAGRPVLMVPDDASRLRANAIVVAWKDTREARRAIADALPLLRRADDVIVQAVCKVEDNDVAVFETSDVVTALKRHGVAARAAVTHARASEVTEVLQQAAELAQADLIVAGAYGHSRAQEWMFGGVTFELLQHAPYFVLMSH